MKTTNVKLGFVLMIIAMIFVIPVAATQPSGDDNSVTCNGGDAICGNQNTGDIIDVEGDYDYDYTVDNSIDNSVNDNRVDNSVYNTDNSVINNDNSVTNNDNKVDNSVTTTTTNNDNRVDNSVTSIDKSVHTSTTSVDIPKGADGGVLISTSNQPPKTSTLDVGESKEYSRLVYPREVLQFEVEAGDIITLKASSDVALYTIGWYPGDDLRINSMDSMPVYDPFYHKFEFGTVVPIDKINYWTMKATLTASEKAKYVIVDNRAPRNSYTHIELTIR